MLYSLQRDTGRWWDFRTYTDKEVGETKRCSFVLLPRQNGSIMQVLVAHKQVQSWIIDVFDDYEKFNSVYDADLARITMDIKVRYGTFSPDDSE